MNVSCDIFVKQKAGHEPWSALHFPTSHIQNHIIMHNAHPDVRAFLPHNWERVNSSLICSLFLNAWTKKFRVSEAALIHSTPLRG